LEEGFPVITCPKCSKENQDHYKFCLGCGVELPRDAAPKAFSPQTPPHGMRAPQGAAVVAAGAPAMANAVAGGPIAVAAGPAAGPPRPPQGAAVAVAAPPLAAPAAVNPVPAPAPVAAPPAPAASATCPQCGHVNAPTNKFCASCGYNMLLAPAAAAAGFAQPAPAPPPFPGAAPAPAYAPAQQPPAAYGAAPAPGPQLTLTALRADGTESGSISLNGPTATIGRDLGGIFSSDSYLSPRHATFVFRAGKLFVKDELSLNGVYIRLAPEQPLELRSGDVFRIGQEIIRFEVLSPQPAGADGVERLGSPARGYVGRICLVTGRDTTGNAFPVPSHGIHIGRERGDILFPEDGYVSGLHCRITAEAGHVYLTDLGSSNGTFGRIGNEREVRPRDVLLMGQQLFRVSF
jgi:pSer/pThr/pTyr-binding forkhead associated (FHA) protein